MIHRFFANGGYFALDVNSGSVHVLDKIAYDVLGAINAPPEGKEALAESLAGLLPYTAPDIKAVLDEVSELAEQELLFSPDIWETYGSTEKPGMPVIKALCLLVAQDCNLRCRYCFAGDGEYGEQGIMTLATAKHAIDFLIKNSGKRRNLEVDFFGGEPLMNFDVVKDTVAYARNLEKENGKCFRFTITTNGILLDDESIKWINDNMHNVVLSLDGREYVNDRFRIKAGGQGSYNAVVSNIQKLVRDRTERAPNKTCYVRGTFTRHNLDFSEDALHLAGLGFKDISVEPVVAPDDSGYALRESDIPRVLEEYDRLAGILGKRKGTPEAFNFFHFMIDLEGGPCAKKRIAGCGAAVEYAAVTTDGSLYPCHQFAGLPDKSDFLMGNVRDGIVNYNITRQFQNTGIYTKDGCRDCFARFYCSGGCAANAYTACGSIRGVYEPGCTLQRRRTELAIALAAEAKKED